MYSYLRKRDECRKKRVMRIRKKVRGTQEKPRLSVVKSNVHIYAQLIDDDAGMTMGSFSSLHKSFDRSVKGRSKESAKVIGQKLAELAKEKNVSAMVLDRGKCKYHGLLAELVSAVRENGISI